MLTTEFNWSGRMEPHAKTIKLDRSPVMSKTFVLGFSRELKGMENVLLDRSLGSYSPYTSVPARLSLKIEQKQSKKFKQCWMPSVSWFNVSHKKKGASKTIVVAKGI